jgi:hypothetical protein
MLTPAGRVALLVLFTSVVVSILLTRKIFKSITLFISLSISGVVLFFLLSLFHIDISGTIVKRYLVRVADTVSDINLQGGNFTMRALQFAAVPDFLGSTERLIFGAGYLNIHPSGYGSMSPFIYAIDYQNIDLSDPNVLNRNVGSAATNELKVPIFFADNGLAGLFASMGFFGMALYLLFISSLIRYSYKEIYRSREILTRALFIGLFCQLLTSPVLFFFMSGYLAPESALHLSVFIGIAMRARQLELARFTA